MKELTQLEQLTAELDYLLQEGVILSEEQKSRLENVVGRLQTISDSFDVQLSLFNNIDKKDHAKPYAPFTAKEVKRGVWQVFDKDGIDFLGEYVTKSEAIKYLNVKPLSPIQA